MGIRRNDIASREQRELLMVSANLLFTLVPVDPISYITYYKLKAFGAHRVHADQAELANSVCVFCLINHPDLVDEIQKVTPIHSTFTLKGSRSPCPWIMFEPKAPSQKNNDPNQPNVDNLTVSGESMAPFSHKNIEHTMATIEDTVAESRDKRFSLDSELPAILLTTDATESPTDLTSETGDEVPPLEKLKSPRTSYNSLLHWGHCPHKHDVEYLVNKYCELPGAILSVEIALSSVPYEAGQSRSPQLGLRLAGHRDLNHMSVFVCGIIPGSICERNGCIEIGDQLLEVNDHTLYGLSHLNAAPIIRSIFLEAIQRSNKIFSRNKLGTIRFVLQRHESNLVSMAVQSNCTVESFSAKSSRRNSRETVSSITSTARNYKVRKSLEWMNLAFGNQRPNLIQHTISIDLLRGSSGFGFAIMEGSPTNEAGIYVKQVVEGGPAAKDGRLCPGDRLVLVNKKDVTSASYEAILELIRSTKHDLRLLVSRWCLDSRRTDTEETMRSSRKRFSAPQLFNYFTAVFRSPDIHGRRPRLSVEQGTFVAPPVTQENLSTTDVDRSTKFLSPVRISSHVRRASSPNLTTLQVPDFNFTTKMPPTRSSLVPTPTRPNGQRSSFCVDRTVQSPAHKEHSELALTQTIVAGSEVQIQLKVTPSESLGIGFVGGSETSLQEAICQYLSDIPVELPDSKQRQAA
ncbi:hypothetical protein P879_00118 [Paragonimus westermani]|uniref:PDZ domain-containing protein n=1 Tax=Paragonimus westermani TaxID=34504 RepID=A0A8T0DWS7_9TREM|nr:hypothetical protein P879_00118 [Paragonimus westermani]